MTTDRFTPVGSCKDNVQGKLHVNFHTDENTHMLIKENSKHAGHSLKSDWPNLSHYVSFAELSKQAWLQSLHYMGRRRCLTLIGFNKMLLPQFWPVFKFITKMSQKPFQVYPTCTTLVRIKAKPFCPGRLMWLPLMLMAPS